MAQVKVYGHKAFLDSVKAKLSDAIHSALMEAFLLPEAKRFQRFISLDEANFIHPSDRTERYLIIEIIMFTGRSVKAKKKLIELTYQKLEPLGLSKHDLEIIMIDMPKHNWGIRGLPADELQLSYKVDV